MTSTYPKEQTNNSDSGRRRSYYEEAMLHATPSTRELSNMTIELPRILPRNLNFGQSHNRLQITRINGEFVKHGNKEQRRQQKKLYGGTISRLLWWNWFHVVLRYPGVYSLSFLLASWTAIVLMFAGIYVGLDTLNKEINCGLGPPGIPIAWGTAFAFSLETCTTVGYGLPGSTNAFFEAKCPSVQVAIYAQMVFSMMFNAFLFAFFFASLSRTEQRAYQVVFSNQIVISIRKESEDEGGKSDGNSDESSGNDGIKIKKIPNDNGTPNVVLQAQFYDLDSQRPIVESHVRFYVLDKSPYPKLHLLRMMSPNDELGGMVFPSLPATVTHHIDQHSMMCPEQHRHRPLVIDSKGMVLRSIDSATASREEIECPVCGESYGTYARWIRHVRYNQMIEAPEKYPPETSHQSIDLKKFEETQLPEVPTIEELQRHFMTNLSEIIVVVEGIDPQLSGTFQALQSYRYEDIAWDCEFVPCLSVGAMGAGHSSGRGYVVDMAKFHQVRPIHLPPTDAAKTADGSGAAAKSSSATTPTTQTIMSSNNKAAGGDGDIEVGTEKNGNLAVQGGSAQ